jgi:hypothetical protein
MRRTGSSPLDDVLNGPYIYSQMCKVLLPIKMTILCATEREREQAKYGPDG